MFGSSGIQEMVVMQQAPTPTKSTYVRKGYDFFHIFHDLVRGLMSFDINQFLSSNCSCTWWDLNFIGQFNCNFTPRQVPNDNP